MMGRNPSTTGFAGGPPPFCKGGFGSAPEAPLAKGGCPRRGRGDSLQSHALPQIAVDLPLGIQVGGALMAGEDVVIALQPAQAA